MYREITEFDSPTDAEIERIARMDRLRWGKLDKTLDQPRRMDGQLTTWRQFISSGKATHKGTMQVHGAIFNRSRYNNMNGEQQAEFDKRYNTMKTAYCLYMADGSFYDCPKIVFEYADLPVKEN